MRRVPYNVIVGVAGVVSGLFTLANAFVTERVLGEPIGLPDPPLFAVIAAIAYGVTANVCFTDGWITELLSRRVWGDRVEVFGEVAFTLGTIFSVLLTLLPAAFLLSVGAFKIVFHSRLIADSIPNCALPPGAKVASFPKDLPGPILNNFGSHLATLAGIGEQFNASDVVTVDRPSRRLIFVRHLGPK